MFFEEMVKEAITRIRKFAVIARAYGFEIAVGFSGGKDSQVVYDLMKRARVEFKAYYNESFESNTTKKFIKEYYPEVVWRKDHKFGFIQNISVNHNGLLPTKEIAYCCADYKHNPKYVDECSVVGVRRAESNVRKNRTTISYKNKRTATKMKSETSRYFRDSCQSVGTASIIQLLPIVDWTDEDVWNYIKVRNLPINPEYRYSNRIGCIVCPKANFKKNYNSLMKYPKLIDAFIRVKESNPDTNYVITSDNMDYANDKVYYICRWLNRSFLPFTKKDEKLYKQIKARYEEIHTKV